MWTRIILKCPHLVHVNLKCGRGMLYSLIMGTSVLERSMTMGDVLIKARTRNSGKVVYEYRFEVASIDGKRQWKSKSGFATKREAGKIAQQHMNMWDKLLNIQI